VPECKSGKWENNQEEQCKEQEQPPMKSGLDLARLGSYQGCFGLSNSLYRFSNLLCGLLIGIEAFLLGLVGIRAVCL
jgi:hypothetical protein